ncbi:cyclic nucleotide-gated channel 17 [Actinidia rufa]|uniref:Cyclic nucleotide-gated channel 17 n=1 Tax=Actinidia rufa TaxID=165716 RepID=A0A7J0EXD6_9ERIC|nr:cyclic nucleotide-gated channel 17 [Actinidia rufa]
MVEQLTASVHQIQRDRHQAGGNGAGLVQPNQPILERPPNYHRNDPRDPIINVEAPNFDGRLDPKAFTDWLREMDHFFECTEQRRQPPVINWVEMREILKEKYLPQSYQGDMLDKWNNLRQGSKPATEYVAQFEEYLMRCDIREDERMTLSRFRQGLNDDLRKELVLREVDTLDQAYTFVQNYEMVSKPSFGRRFESRNTPRPPATLPPSRSIPNTTAPLLRDSFGHKAANCGNRTLFVNSQGQNYEGDDIEEQFYEPDLENLPESDEDCEGGDVTLGVVRCALTQAKEDNDWRRNAIFYTYIKCGEKDCKILFYSDKIWCDVVPMDVGHIILGRPWLFDMDVTIYGCSNSCSFLFENKRIKLNPLQPKPASKQKKENPTNGKGLNIIGPKEFEREINDQSTLFAVVAHETSTESQDTPPEEVTSILQEFHELIHVDVVRSSKYEIMLWFVFAPSSHFDVPTDPFSEPTHEPSIDHPTTSDITPAPLPIFPAPKEHIDAILDEQIISTRDGSQIDRDLFEYYQSRPVTHSTESNFLHPGRVGGDTGSKPPITRVYSRRSRKAYPTYLQSITVRLEECRLKRRDTEEWMGHRQLPEDLKQRVRCFVQYKWLATRGVDEEAILRGLPADLRRDIQRHLCLDLVRRVPLFSQMDDQLLDAICERLVSSLSTEGTYIVREGDPVMEMLFIIRGRLDSSTTNGGRTGFFNSTTLRPGDFCGEELLAWALLPKSTTNLPSSTRTVTALVEVEAFALLAEDLKFVANQFRRLHSKKLQHTFRFYSPHWRTWAACFIQAAWRRYKRRKLTKDLTAVESFDSDEKVESGAGQEEVGEDYTVVSNPSQAKLNLGVTVLALRFAANTRRGAQKIRDLPKLQKPEEPDFSAAPDD